MNRIDKFALGIAILITVLCAREMMAITRFYIETLHLSGVLITIGVVGWLIATYGPMAVAVLFWRLAKKRRASWLLHILFLPCALVLLRAGGSIMLFVIQQPDFDAMLGGPSVPAMLMFLIAVGGYFAAVISRWLSETLKARWLRRGREERKGF